MAAKTIASAGVNELISQIPNYLDYTNNENDESDSTSFTFTLDGVPCAVSFRGIGAGEDRITVIYGSNDVNISSSINSCYMPNFSKGVKMVSNGKQVTSVKMNLERKRGKYIMDGSIEFTTNRNHTASINKLNISPNGYSLSGPFIF